MTVTAQATFVATLVDEWARAGISDAVVAPGSRSTPLALALACDPRIRVHVHLDERSAGFFALGIGLASGVPAVVVTTSGTAAVELHPAVVEASQARVPLLVCTADRPGELHHVGAPQTVEQTRLFGDVTRWFVEPGPASGLPEQHWRSIASRMVVEATCGPLGPGPVHANLAFRDPLVADPGTLPPGRDGGRPWHSAAAGRGTRGAPLALSLSGKRGLVVAGAGAPTATGTFAGALGWPVLADARSGLRGTPHAVAAFDAILRHEGVPTPEVVVRVGAPPASKVLGQWLADLPAATEQLVVDPHGGWPDPERRATQRLDVLPAVDGSAASDPRWRSWWRDAESAAQQAIDRVLASRIEPSEPGTIRDLTRDLPAETVLFLSSSMPIRDIEWFGHPSSRHRVLANRGANGIDGIIATALGVAASDPGRPVVAVLGDLAFLYDAGSLLWAPSRGVDLTLVVLDNGGGGIFSFLPQREHLPHDRFEQLFGTPHDVDLIAVAAAYGVPEAASVGEGSGVRLVRVVTDRDDNVALHAALNAAVAAALPPAG